jgi:hypothetical protein
MLGANSEVVGDVLVESWLDEAEVVEHLPDDSLTGLASDKQIGLVDTNGRIEALIDSWNFGCR